MTPRRASARVAERAPLIAPNAQDADGIDIETNERESARTSASSRVSARTIALATALVAGCAGAVAVVALAQRSPTVVMPRLPMLGNTNEWRAAVARGEVSREDLDMAAKIPSKACAPATRNDANEYFIMKTVNALPDLKKHLSVGRGADFPHAFDHHDAEAAFLVGTNDQAKESPTALPKNGYVKAIKQIGERAMVYHFIHVPKAGGTYFNEVLARVVGYLNSKFGTATPGPRAGGIYPFWTTAPLLDATAHGVFHTTYDMAMKVSPFNTEKLAKDYAAGRRLFSKGSYNMGMCATTEAPCMYLTVLRNPFDRFMSHYKYSCLEGAEGQAMWLPEWKNKGECPLDPLEWYQYTQGDDWTHLLAPGAYPRDSECHVETVKANLQSGCMRYLLTEKLGDGLMKMKKHLPDFSSFNPAAARGLFTNGSSSRLTPKLKARLDAYNADEEMMNTIREGLKHQFKVYDFAVEHYESHWEKPIATC